MNKKCRMDLKNEAERFNALQHATSARPPESSAVRMEGRFNGKALDRIRHSELRSVHVV